MVYLITIGWLSKIYIMRVVHCNTIIITDPNLILNRILTVKRLMNSEVSQRPTILFHSGRRRYQEWTQQSTEPTLQTVSNFISPYKPLSCWELLHQIWNIHKSTYLIPNLIFYWNTILLWVLDSSSFYGDEN